MPPSKSTLVPQTPSFAPIQKCYAHSQLSILNKARGEKRGVRTKVARECLGSGLLAWASCNSITMWRFTKSSGGEDKWTLFRRFLANIATPSRSSQKSASRTSTESFGAGNHSLRGCPATHTTITLTWAISPKPQWSCQDFPRRQYDWPNFYKWIQ